jgi:hypothetical protein
LAVGARSLSGLQTRCSQRYSLFPLVTILSSLSLVHAYWALGGRWEVLTSCRSFGARSVPEPSPIATWVVCGLLTVAAILVIGKAGWMRTGNLGVAIDVGVWGLSFVFLLRAVGNLKTFGFFKTNMDTPFAQWDTCLYSPLCLLIALLAGCLAWLPQRR